jgi:surface polysaccharide O-acyltransferase-like enzyme
MLQVLANIDTNLTYTCGDIGVSFSGMFPYIISVLVLIIKIAVPIILIIFGMLDLAKAIMAQKEDEIKKGQQTFIKRCIAAVIVFFVVMVVQMVVSFVSNDNDDISSCLKCFINGDASGCKVDTTKDIEF